MPTTDIVFTEEIRVELVKTDFSDEWPCFAAWTSTRGDEASPEVKKGLINALMRERHGSPWEHMWATFRVTAPIFVWREHHRHRMACVAEGTVVELRGGNGDYVSHKKPIEKIWEHWHLLPAHRSLRIRTWDENNMHAQVADVLEVSRNGIKPLVTITTESGRELTCTPNHHILTGEGWALAGDVRERDWLFRSGKGRDGEPEMPPMLRRAIGVWVTKVKPQVVRPVDTCYLCGNEFPYAALQVDHVIPVVKDLARALDITNLKPACAPCHRLKTNDEQKFAARLGSFTVARPDRVVSVKSAGTGMTYDISVDGPWHNYTANGLVVHNSYNEESGRYKKLDPVFYIPGRDRDLQQVGKAMDYQTVPGTDEQYKLMVDSLKSACTIAYANYESMLDAGVMREVARMCLPVNIMSTCVVTMNARGLMNFLSLRVRDEAARFPSKPQAEINLVALGYEEMFKEWAPITYQAFIDNGRVAP